VLCREMNEVHPGKKGASGGGEAHTGLSDQAKFYSELTKGINAISRAKHKVSEEKGKIERADPRGVLNGRIGKKVKGRSSKPKSNQFTEEKEVESHKHNASQDPRKTAATVRSKNLAAG